MEAAELLYRIKHLNVWKKEGQRAPHKPLLILLALGQFQCRQTVLPYETVRPKLSKLLEEFGPPRRSYHPEEPFVRLTTDGIWTLTHEVDKRSFSSAQLLREGIAGGFTQEVLELLTRMPELVQQVAEHLLLEILPDSTHADLLEEVGLDFATGLRQRRDPKFRERILRAYEHRCAICDFNVRLGHILVGIEAAHIQWHQAGGPDSEENGIALCALHHKLFDRGVFTITDQREMMVAEHAHGTHGFEEWLMRYHGQKIRMPIHPLYLPRASFLHWHSREVFKGPARFHTG